MENVGKYVCYDKKELRDYLNKGEKDYEMTKIT
jgi:hypothetical protein